MYNMENPSPTSIQWMDDPTPEEFSTAVEEYIEEYPEYGSFLTAHTPDELSDHELILSADKRVGAAVSPDGDIQNVFNNDGPAGGGRLALVMAMFSGGVTLDCYDGHLPRMYADYGFRETGRMEWNDDFAPEDWNYERFNSPDVVFMHLDPSVDYSVSDNYYGFDEWELAKQDSRREARPATYGGGARYRVGERERRSDPLPSRRGRRHSQRRRGIDKQHISSEIEKAVDEAIDDKKKRDEVTRLINESVEDALESA